MKLVVASNNKHKIAEIKAILGEKFDEIYSLDEMNITADPDETADTFFGNSLIKAQEICSICSLPTIADDSGLMVDFLNGAPGVHSARFAGIPCNDEKNNLLLLEKLDGVKNRDAKFVSCVVLYYPDGTYVTATGEAEGTILTSPVGCGGFGYDPLFMSKELNKTFASITSDEKNLVSHRKKALEKLLEKL